MPASARGTGRSLDPCHRAPPPPRPDRCPLLARCPHPEADSPSRLRRRPGTPVPARRRAHEAHLQPRAEGAFVSTSGRATAKNADRAVCSTNVSRSRAAVRAAVRSAATPTPRPTFAVRRRSGRPSRIRERGARCRRPKHDVRRIDRCLEVCANRGTPIEHAVCRCETGGFGDAARLLPVGSDDRCSARTRSPGADEVVDSEKPSTRPSPSTIGSSTRAAKNCAPAAIAARSERHVEQLKLFARRVRSRDRSGRAERVGARDFRSVRRQPCH